MFEIVSGSGLSSVAHDVAGSGRPAGGRREAGMRGIVLCAQYCRSRIIMSGLPHYNISYTPIRVKPPTRNLHNFSSVPGGAPGFRIGASAACPVAASRFRSCRLAGMGYGGAPATAHGCRQPPAFAFRIPFRGRDGARIGAQVARAVPLGGVGAGCTGSLRHGTAAGRLPFRMAARRDPGGLCDGRARGFGSAAGRPWGGAILIVCLLCIVELRG